MYKNSSQVGYKFFKKNEDGNIEIIRLVKAKSYKDPTSLPAIVTIEKEDKSREKIESKLLKEYTPLEPDGVIMFSIVEVSTYDGTKFKDVVVTGTKFLNMKLGDIVPFVICRQNVIDIYNNLIVQSDDDYIYGCSINQNNCPSNYDFRAFLQNDKVIDTITVNIYRTDTLEDILSLINTTKFDEVLLENKNIFIKNDKEKNINITKAMFKNSYKGWCKDLKTLLIENNFSSDINEMFGIVDVDFNLKDYMIIRKLPNGEEYDSVDDDMILWLSSLYNAPIKEITVLKYYHDINLGEFNNSRYFFLRDNSNNLYMVVYTINGEIKEADLIEEANKKELSKKFKLSFFNKYRFDSKKEFKININT